MPRKLSLAFPLAAAAVLVASGAHAATRSADALPSQAANNAAKAEGPKQGFPSNHGIDRAKEVANEHAKFLRTDSNG